MAKNRVCILCMELSVYYKYIGFQGFKKPSYTLSTLGVFKFSLSQIYIVCAFFTLYFKTVL